MVPLLTSKTSIHQTDGEVATDPVHTLTGSFSCFGGKTVSLGGLLRIRWLRFVLRCRFENSVLHRRRGGGRRQANLVWL